MSVFWEVVLLFGGIVAVVGGAKATYLAWTKPDYYQKVFLPGSLCPRIDLWTIRLIAPFGCLVGAVVTLVMLGVFIARVM